MNLKFQFQSFSDLLMMSGHGPYVWGAYAITIAGLVFLVLQARHRRKQVLKNINIAAARAQDVRK